MLGSARGAARAAAALASACLLSCGSEEVDFSGTWEGFLTVPSTSPTAMLLQQQGQDVAGTLGGIALVGRVHGETLSFSLTYGGAACSGAATGSATVTPLADRDRMQMSYLGADCSGPYSASAWFDRLRCPGGMLACSAGYAVNSVPYCANGQTDEHNCGSCGTRCGEYEVCTAGSCQVPACTGPIRLQAPSHVWVAMTLAPLALADMDSDGAPDAVALDLDSRTLAVLRGNGRGGFASPVETALTSAPVAMAIGDLDRDGRPDVVVYQVDYDARAGAIQVLLGTGDGSFLAGQGLPGGVESVYPGPRVVALADLDGDGVLDLAARMGNDPAVRVRLGLGDGTFGPAREYALPGRAQALVASDLDRDGHVDLAVLSFRGYWEGGPRLSVLRGAGDGTFRNDIDLPGLDDPHDLAVGDFDGNGIPDLVATTSSSVATVLIGSGDGTFAPPIRIAQVPWCGYYSLAVADLDGDGDQDVVASNCGGLEVVPGRGDGTFEPSVTYRLPHGALSVAAAHLDDGGGTDLVVGNREGGLSVFLACPP